MTAAAKIEEIKVLAAQVNEGNLEAVRKKLSPNFFAYTPSGDEPRQNDTFVEFLQDFQAAISGFRISLSDLVEDAGLVRGTMAMQGMHDGALWNVPPSGVEAFFSCEIALRNDESGWAISLENVTPPRLMAALRPMGVIPPPEDMNKPLKYPFRIPEMLTRLMFTGQVADKPCSHLDMIRFTDPQGSFCEDCPPGSAFYPTVRMCLICGHLGCCDTSNEKHARQHYEETGHPLMRSIREDEAWIWCYEDNAFFSSRTLDKYRQKLNPAS